MNVNNLRCRRHDLSNILKLQAAFLQVTSLFHISRVDFMHFNTCCAVKFILGRDFNLW